MKYFHKMNVTIIIKRMLVLTAVLLLCSSLYAQDKADTVQHAKDTVKAVQPKPQYWKLKSNVILSTEQAQISNWAAGGYSSFAFSGLFKGFYNYAKGKNKLDNTVELSYGRTRQDVTGEGIMDKSNKWIKSEDKIELNSLYGRTAFSNWNYSALVNIKSQFDRGWKNDTMLISTFLSPAVLTSSVGFEYKASGFSALFSFLTGKTTYCRNEELRGKNPVTGYNYGYTDENADAWKFSLGSYIKLFYQKDVFTNVNVMAKLDVFYDYDKPLMDTDISGELFVNMKVNKYLSAFLNIQAAIDKDFSTHIQFKERFGISVPLSF